jgi:subtilisin family serine protease
MITLTPLPSAGPFGWWQWLSGAAGYNPAAGEGVRVGVIDSGVGPHPFLDHATPIGAFLDGAVSMGETAGRDVQTHGTHVSGIIGARPNPPSAAFAGVAPGAELLVARIFGPNGGGNQGDVANAVGSLSDQHQADILNMSFIGAPSAIEHDAIILAWRRGTVCVCAAGNQNGAAVGYPAAYPECVAVSALGLMNGAPADSMPGWNLPSAPDRWTASGLFLASFSNVGPQIAVAAPGNGIVSTIPAREGSPRPYADMSGTSMSAPMTTGVLARLLSQDKEWAEAPRDASRSARARSLLALHAMSLGLVPAYQGAGLARMM